MTMTTGVDVSPQLALQALLAKDLTAFTEFAFGVVRPGVPLKWNWHLDALTCKLSQLAKGYIRRLLITQPPPRSNLYAHRWLCPLGFSAIILGSA